MMSTPRPRRERGKGGKKTLVAIINILRKAEGRFVWGKSREKAVDEIKKNAFQ